MRIENLTRKVYMKDKECYSYNCDSKPPRSYKVYTKVYIDKTPRYFCSKTNCFLTWLEDMHRLR